MPAPESPPVVITPAAPPTDAPSASGAAACAAGGSPSRLYAVVAAAGAYVPQPGKTYDALVDRASPYLPATLSGSLARRRLGAATPPPPPQVLLAVRRLGVSGAEAPELSLPASMALSEAQRDCHRVLGIPPERQLLLVEGRCGRVSRGRMWVGPLHNSGAAAATEVTSP